MTSRGLPKLVGPRSRSVVRLALLLAVGTVAWEHLVHAYLLGHGDTLTGHLTHLLRDGLLAFPLAVLAVVGGLAVSSRLGLGASGRHLVGQAILVSIVLGLLMVPAVGVHDVIDATLSGKSPGLAQVALGGLLWHAVEDALIGQVAALPLAILGLGLASRAAGPRRKPRLAGWSFRRLALAGGLLVVLLGLGSGQEWVARFAQATPFAAVFQLTDEPGPWFRCAAGSGCVPAGTQSLAVVSPGSPVKFLAASETETVHTATSLLWPLKGDGSDADNMPFDQPAAYRGSRSVTLTTPGLYVFVCKLHPFMLGAVVVDDAATPALDLGDQIRLVNGVTVPTTSDLAVRLLRAFFLITNPANYQDRNPATNPALAWVVTLPPVPVRLTGGVEVPLSALSISTTVEGPLTPATAGVGEIWVDAEYEKTAGKTKPGTATAVDATTWQVTKKAALPHINMNNPHNMWTDRDQTVIYQTQWFSNKLAVFDRQTLRLLRNINVGHAPAHVMTRVDTDQVHVSINGEDAVVELSRLGRKIDRKIPVQFKGENPAQPHAHWMSFDGRTMVTPNSNTADATQINVVPGTIAAKTPTGTLPIATGMMPDASKYYVSNYVDSTITCISIGPPACNAGGGPVPMKTIDLLANYNPVSGAITGPVGALPIQTPVSPHGKWVITANTLTATITIIDTATDELVAMLPCSAGCHGVNFGAKKNGGYYAYVSSKFSNDLLVVDPDPNGDGQAVDATIVGRVILVADQNTLTDDTPTLYQGMGGQGVLPIPLVYHGWVQKLPSFWKDQLTGQQRNPFP
jgi:DNA-binding beta-propeller fold protein YncE